MVVEQIQTNATRYTTNGAINTNQDVDQNITDLTVGNSGMITWNYGQFGVVSDRIKTSVFSFSEDNIFGKLQIGKLGFDNKLNELTAKFDSVASNEQEEQVIRRVPESNRNINEPVLERTLTLPMTNNAIEARRVTAIYLNKSRQDLTISFTTSLEASGVESGDIVSITHATPGFLNKLFIVHSIEEKVVNNIIGLEITGQEYADGVYTDQINDQDPAPNTRLPNPFAAPLIENLDVEEDEDIDEANLSIDWNEAANSVLIDSTEIGYRLKLTDTTVASGTPYVYDQTNGVSLTVTSGGLLFPAAGTILVGVETGTSSVETGEQPVVTNPGILLTYTSRTDTVFSGIDVSNAPLDSATNIVTFTGSAVTLPLTFKSTSGGTSYELSPLISSTARRITVTITGTATGTSFATTLTPETGTAETTTASDLVVGDTAEIAAAKIAISIDNLSNYSVTISGAVITITGELGVGNFTIATPTVENGITLTLTETLSSAIFLEYFVQITAISTLGNRSITLQTDQNTGVARVVGLQGEAGQDGQQGAEGAAGAAGEAADIFRFAGIYKVENSGDDAPATPTTTNTIFNGTLTALTTNTEVWLIEVPTNFNNSTQKLYVSEGLFKQTNGTGDFVIEGNWSTPIQISGTDGKIQFERSVYINQNNTPVTPTTADTFINGVLTGATGDNSGTTETWTAAPFASDTVQRWVSRTTICPAADSLEIAEIDFSDTASGDAADFNSGILTEATLGVKEAGFFDISGVPGNNIDALFETATATTESGTVTGTFTPATFESNLFTISGLAGTLSGGGDGSPESAVVAISGVSSQGKPYTRFPNEVFFSKQIMKSTSISEKLLDLVAYVRSWCCLRW